VYLLFRVELLFGTVKWFMERLFSSGFSLYLYSYSGVYIVYVCSLELRIDFYFLQALVCMNLYVRLFWGVAYIYEMHTYIYICIYVYTYIHISEIHICIYMCIYMCMYIYICMFI